RAPLQLGEVVELGSVMVVVQSAVGHTAQTVLPEARGAARADTGGPPVIVSGGVMADLDRLGGRMAAGTISVLPLRETGVGQGGGGGGGARPLAARVCAAGEDQLRGAVGDAARERAVRPREGRLHRRRAGQAGAARDGARRLGVPRRGGRAAAGDAGEALAR